MPGLELDVTDTKIQCYSGCLTSSNVVVTGASDDCHDGSIMQRFLIVLGVGLVIVLSSTVIYRYLAALNSNNSNNPDHSGTKSSGSHMCGDLVRYIGCCFDFDDYKDKDKSHIDTTRYTHTYIFSYTYIYIHTYAFIHIIILFIMSHIYIPNL